MLQIHEIELVSDDGTAATVGVLSLGRALWPDSLASVLVDWLSTYGCWDPHPLGCMVGRALHRAPAMHGSVVRLLAGVLAGLAEYPLEWTGGRNRVAGRLARELMTPSTMGRSSCRSFKMTPAALAGRRLYPPLPSPPLPSPPLLALARRCWP